MTIDPQKQVRKEERKEVKEISEVGRNKKR